MSYPKVVALDTDWTIWKEFLDYYRWGRGPNAFTPIEDNIERPDYDNKSLRDRTNHNNYVRVFDDTSRVVNDILRNGAKLAIVSRNPSRAMCDRALYYFNTRNPSNNKVWSIIDLVKYNEVVDEPKTQPFRRILGQYKGQFSDIDYSDMVLFDDEAVNNVIRIELGSVFQFVRDGHGLTWETYHLGLDAWRRTKNMMHKSPSNTAKRALIGYSGLSRFWIDLIGKGEGIVDRNTPYRWGYALYVADMIGIAKAYSDWDREGWGNDSYVCEIWVKDYDAWAAINKIWVPENDLGLLMDNMHWTDEENGRFQENRDRFISQRWAVQAPYILFSRHHWFHILPDYARPRSNEMVVYTQIQRSLFEVVRLDDSTVAQFDPQYGPFPFHRQINTWNVTLPQETIDDLKASNDDVNLFN